MAAAAGGVVAAVLVVMLVDGDEPEEEASASTSTTVESGTDRSSTTASSVPEPPAEPVRQPLDPGSPPTSPPLVEPFFSCLERSDDEVWAIFGYEHIGERSLTISLDLDPSVVPRNRVVVGTDSTRINRGQPSQFLPGRHERALAVRVDGSAPVRWELDTHQLDDEDEVGTSVFEAQWLVAAESGATPCPAGTSTRIPVVQDAFLDLVGTDVVRDLDGTILAFDVEVTVNSVVTACDGGEPLPPRIVLAYDLADVNLARPDFDEVVDFADGTFGFTAEASRQVLDPALDATTTFMADVHGRCAYPDGEVVESAMPYYAPDGWPFTYTVVGAGEVPEEDRPVIRSVGPGGRRFR